MHKTIAEARALVRELRALPLPVDVEVVLAPPFTALAAVAQELESSPIALGAQTMHDFAHGPYTGEISAPMLCELGVTYVILGHSERRAFNAESDEAVNRKVFSALVHGLTPIVAVGETATEHEGGETYARVTLQTRAAFADVSREDVARCVVAYEPIWAIGTGLNDTPASANEVIAQIRACVPGLERARILYGGSMRGENAAELMAMPDIDGGLIGGASLTATSFAAVIDGARAKAGAS